MTNSVNAFVPVYQYQQSWIQVLDRLRYCTHRHMLTTLHNSFMCANELVADDYVYSQAFHHTSYQVHTRDCCYSLLSTHHSLYLAPRYLSEPILGELFVELSRTGCRDPVYVALFKETFFFIRSTTITISQNLSVCRDKLNQMLFIAYLDQSILAYGLQFCVAMCIVRLLI